MTNVYTSPKFGQEWTTIARNINLEERYCRRRSDSGALLTAISTGIPGYFSSVDSNGVFYGTRFKFGMNFTTQKFTIALNGDTWEWTEVDEFDAGYSDTPNSQFGSVTGFVDDGFIFTRDVAKELCKFDSDGVETFRASLFHSSPTDSHYPRTPIHQMPSGNYVAYTVTGGNPSLTEFAEASGAHVKSVTITDAAVAVLPYNGYIYTLEVDSGTYWLRWYNASTFALVDEIEYPENAFIIKQNTTPFTYALNQLLHFDSYGNPIVCGSTNTVGPFRFRLSLRDPETLEKIIDWDTGGFGPLRMFDGMLCIFSGITSGNSYTIWDPIGETNFLHYPELSGGSVSLGTPDAGQTVPALDGIDFPKSLVVAQHIYAARTAIEAMATCRFFQTDNVETLPDTSEINWTDQHEYNLYRCAMGYRAEYGFDETPSGYSQFYAYDWAKATLHEPSRVDGTDGKVYRCIRTHVAINIYRPITGGAYTVMWEEETDEDETGETWVLNETYGPNSTHDLDIGEIRECSDALLGVQTPDWAAPAGKLIHNWKAE